VPKIRLPMPMQQNSPAIGISSTKMRLGAGATTLSIYCSLMPATEPAGAEKATRRVGKAAMIDADGRPVTAPLTESGAPIAA
jgi:hypothetical protein